MARITPASNGLLTNKRFSATPFLDGSVKVLHADTQFAPYQCKEIRDVWPTYLGTFVPVYSPPTGWPVPQTLIRRPRVVLMEHAWTNFWVDDTITELRMDNWVSIYNAVVSHFSGGDEVAVIKGCSWIGDYSDYSGGLQGNSGADWSSINGDPQRVDRVMTWFLPPADDIADVFVGLDILHIVLFKNMGFTKDHYENTAGGSSLEPGSSGSGADDYVMDIADWIAVHDQFVGRALFFYIDSNGEYTGESGISGNENLAEDVAICATIASDLSAYGVESKGSTALASAAAIIADIETHFGL